MKPNAATTNYSIKHVAISPLHVNKRTRKQDCTLVSFNPEHGCVFQHRRPGSSIWLERRIPTNRIIYLYGKPGVKGGAEIIYEAPVQLVKLTDVRLQSSTHGVLVGVDNTGATVAVRSSNTEVERVVGKLGNPTAVKAKAKTKPVNKHSNGHFAHRVRGKSIRASL